MKRQSMLLLLLLLVLLGVAHGEESRALLRLSDGRVLYGRDVKRSEKTAVLRTDFGTLVVPKDRLAKGTSTTAPPTPRERVTRTRWLEITHDLSERRAKLYADQLDTFFDWMVKVYALDLDRTRAGAPYKMRVFRRRRDFKELQTRVAPGIEQKGKAFAEGVAGFYSRGHGRIFMWDAEGARGGVHLEVAKHETTHLLNHLLAGQIGIRVPTWFEEGAATYFSTFVASGDAGRAEPEDHPGAYAQVLGEIESNKPMTSRELRSVKWAEFLGRQYSWGWAQVRFFRHHKQGKYWGELLRYLRTIAPMGVVSDSEERRFLKMSGFKDSDKFDRAWYEHLRAAKPEAERALVGTSPEVLARVAAVEKPDPATARNFARLGISLARVHEYKPAIVYLRAALRGEVDDAEVPYRLALALAGIEGLSDDEPWPEGCVTALGTAVRLAPLRAAYRVALGRQMLLAGEVERAYRTMGLALVLAGPDDDDVRVALELLRAAAAFRPDADLEKTIARLAESVPPAAGALRTALVYHLQETEDWERLAGMLERKLTAGDASIEERAMLAGLLKAADELERAEAIYAGILESQPKALRYWPDRIECLMALGRKADAKVARAEALKALSKDPRDLGAVRRRIRRLKID